MKEKKFRAFADYKMRYPLEADWWFFGQNGYWSLNTASGEIICDSLESKDPFLEEYTGLMDKNGVEIYEGDIIAVPYCESLLSYGPSVEVGTDVFEVFWDTDMLRWELRELNGLHGTEGLCDYDESDIKIIGNIHENSGLMEAE